jgi:hypothetical protein
LSNNPKKVFRRELPILTLIYSFLGMLMMFTGLAFGGPMGGSKISYLLFVLAPVPIVLIWISLLTISLYFYYKKNNLLNDSFEKIKPQKSNISLKTFWIPLAISSVFSFLIYFFGNSFTSYLTEHVLTGIANFYSDYLPLYTPLLIPTILITVIPAVFIIRRLLSKNPKNVFRIELPVLVIIYSILSNYFVFVNFIFGELMELPILKVLFSLFFTPLFILLWLSALTISLYFHYKKNNFFRKK